MGELLAAFADWLPELLGGLWISFEVTLGALALGIPFGLALALAVGSSSTALRALTLAIVEIGRGAPALIVLQFFYFGLPNAGLTLEPLAAAILALAWNTGAYTSEIIRAGLEAVPRGQREAGVALGFERLDQMRYVILPQALRIALPALLGFSILIFQSTSLCFAIALPELISRAYEIGSATFRYFPVLVLAGALYAAISIPASYAVAAAERHLGRHLYRPAR